MANCKYTLPEDLLRKLSTIGNRMDDISEVVLEEGGEVVLDKVKANLRSVLSGKSSGELESALGLSKVRIDRNGNHNIKIGFREPRKDGKTNYRVWKIQSTSKAIFKKG